MKTTSAASVLAATAWTVVVLLGSPAAGAEPALVAPRIGGAGPILDPDLRDWRRAKPVAVAMTPQEVTEPRHPNAAVKELRVRAAHNGQWLAVQIEWRDPTKSDTIVLDQFGDQVAIEFPIEYKKDELPSPMMGNPGGRVNVLQWRAPFQRDLDKGEPQIADLYPNAVIDLYPDDVLRATDVRPYTGALGVDNPISRPQQSPVLDQMAEGWGTMTVKPDQHGDGRGAWKDGVWRVVITMPMATESTNSPRFTPGAKTVVAFAVWEGGNREVGARKAWSNWVPLTLAR